MQAKTPAVWTGTPGRRRWFVDREKYLLTSQRTIGVPILILSVVLLIVGLSASPAIAALIRNTLTGRATWVTTRYILGGIVTGLLGFAMLYFIVRGRNA